MAKLSTTDYITWMLGPDNREDHRKQYSDMAWAAHQDKGNPRYNVGDVVEFCVGGFGVIDVVSNPKGGWPSRYSTKNVDGMNPHKTRKSAWHYEGDFKRLAGKVST